MLTRQLIKLKYVADYIFRGDAPKYVESDGITVISQGCVQTSGLNFSKSKLHDKNDIDRISGWLQKSDILINSTGTGTLGRVSYVENHPKEPMFADGHVTIVRDSKERFCPKFLFFYLSILQEPITVYCSEGATNQIELSRPRFGSLLINWPTIGEQESIARFLENKITHLDALIAEKGNLLQLLSEKRRALIASAVTRGIDPTARLKESGIPWLGLVPEHWDVTRAKNLFKEVDQRSTTGEETLLSLRMQIGLVPHNDVSEKVIPSGELIGYKIALPNQIVVNRMRAASGLISLVPQPGIVSPDYAVFEPKSGVSAEYYTLLFTTPLLQVVFRSESKGLGTGESGFLRLYSDNFLSVYMPKPQLEEQHAITDYLKTETTKLDALKEVTESTIALLRERRTALISAAVTGMLEIEVKNAN